MTKLNLCAAMRIVWEIVAGILWRWDLGPNFRLAAITWICFMLIFNYVTTYVWGV